jgi:predicted MFS family arabinose efflux permease
LSPNILETAPPAANFSRQLQALMIGGFCAMASARVCDPMLPRLAADFGGTVSSAARVVASFALAYGLSQLLYGPLGDRYGKLRVIFFASVAASVGAAVSALSLNLEWLTWARLFGGATSAGVIPLAIAWVGDSVPYSQRQAVMARFMVGTLSGLVLGQMLGGFATDTLGWRAAFWLIALAYAFCAFRLGRSATKEIFARRPADALKSPWWQNTFSNYRGVLRRPLARLVLPVVLLEGFLVISALAFIPSFIHQRDAVSLSRASLAVAGFGLGGLLYAWQAQAWLKRLGELGFARVGALCFGLGLTLMAMVPGFAVALGGCFAAGVGFYMLHNTLQTLGSQISPESRGSAMSLFAFGLFAGQTVGIGMAAWGIAHFSYRPVFLVSAVGTTALGLFLAGRLHALQKKDPAQG